jgi:hypothetical protein
LWRVDVNTCGGILEFYQKYLSAKQQWLKNADAFIKKNKFNDVAIEAKYGQFLPIERPKDKQAAIDKMKNKNYSKIPVFLPRGLFNAGIAKALGLEAATNNVFADKTPNAVYALKTMFKDDTQPFYLLPHYYKHRDEETKESVVEERIAYLKNMQSEIVRLEDLKKYDKLYEDEEYELKNYKRDERRFFEHERLIRYIQSTDRALWLMIKERVKAEHTNIEDDLLTLADIEKVLDIELETSISIHNRTITAKLPIRCYGDLRRIAKDRRLESLVKYYDENTVIDYAEIEKELIRYDERRELFFGKIYEFEKKVYTKYMAEFVPLPRPVIVKGATEMHPFYDHNYYMEVATNHLTDRALADHYKNNVVILRNKPSHNELPDYKSSIKPDTRWLEPLIDFNAKGYVNQIFDIAEKYYKDLLALI